MAKATKEVMTEGKSVEELKELAVTLQNQGHRYREMAIKAQGALEVILQLIPKEAVEEMIAEEASQRKAPSDG